MWITEPSWRPPGILPTYGVAWNKESTHNVRELPSWTPPVILPTYGVAWNKESTHNVMELPSWTPPVILPTYGVVWNKDNTPNIRELWHTTNQYTWSAVFYPSYNFSANRQLRSLRPGHINNTFYTILNAFDNAISLSIEYFNIRVVNSAQTSHSASLNFVVGYMVHFRHSVLCSNLLFWNLPKCTHKFTAGRW